MPLFRQKISKEKLIDSLDLEIEEHSKRSRMLRDVGDKYRRKAAELASEGMDEAAKKWLTLSLLCKQMRSNIESTMADLENAKMQLLTQPDRPTSTVIEKVNQILRRSVAERERSLQAFNRMSAMIQSNIEQTIGELETYGIKEEAINEEFQKLKGELGLAERMEGKLEVEKPILPEIPKRKEEELKKEERIEKAEQVGE